MKKELPKAYEPKKYEDGIYEKWETAKPNGGYFNPDNLDLDKTAETYSIVLPPPNVTGTLHMGHAAMLAIEDILIRYHRMKGCRTLWVPGTDHAAIATQTKVEKILKEEGTDRHRLGREKFLKRVEGFARQSHDIIVNQVKKMGASCDWSREAYTLDETRHRAVYSVFKLMYDDGLIYRGKRIVNWCPRCHSVLADDEVEYKEQKGKLYWLKYGPFILATTRPETKLGDTAVAVHPDDKRYKKMVGKKYMIPGVLGEFEITVVADKAVDPDFGSGAIKVTPAHSFIDNEIAARHGIGMKQIINEDGRMMDNCGKYAGMTTVEARKEIVKDMAKLNLIEKVEDNYKHNIALCYRCDAQIEPIPSEQWFIDVNKPLSARKSANKKTRKQEIDWEGKSIKDVALEAVKSGKIKILPKRFEKNYYHWMENLRDWCISRQIWYGHQVPVWYRGQENKKTRKQENKKEIYVGVEAPEGKEWIQDEDTLDTWFSSGLWTFSTLAGSPEQIKIKDGRLVIDSDDFKNFHPTQVMETGYDILFFWVARMIIMTTYAIGDIPFEDVYLHGLVLDDKGKKMSKSKGNVINPLDMCKKYGTDATRLSLVIGSAPGNDLRLNEDKIAGFRNFSNKLWNVSRYILQATDSRPPFAKATEGRQQTAEIDYTKLTDADHWILEEFRGLNHKVEDCLKSYKFSEAGEVLRAFTWNTLADWYIEATKFLKGKETEKVLMKILKDLLKLWHPFIPFVTEVIWKKFNGSDLIIESWPKAEKAPHYKNDKVIAEKVLTLGIIFDLIKRIRNARAEHKISPGKKLKAVIYAPKNKEDFERHAVLIKSLKTNISELKITGKKVNYDNEIKIVDENIIVYLIGAVDKEKEKERIKKETANKKKMISLIEKKFENGNFMKKAPKEIVEEQKNKLNKLKKELEEIMRQ